MVPGNECFTTLQGTGSLHADCKITQRKVPQHPNVVIWGNDRVPMVDKRLVVLGY